MNFLLCGHTSLFSLSDYINSLNTVIGSANKVYNEFLQSEDGMGFCGQVSLVGDSVGSILAYDALCRPYTSSQGRRLSESSVAGHEEEGNKYSILNFLRHQLHQL